MIDPRVAIGCFLAGGLALFLRMPPRKAVTACILLASMFLPVRGGWDLPLLPPIDKNTAGVLTAFLGCLWMGRRQLLAASPGRGLDLWILVLAVGAIGTTLTNHEPIYARIHVPGLGLRDILSMVVRDLLAYGLPFFMGKALIRTPEALRDLLRAFVWAGIVYSLLALVEMRLSPQMHLWIYGFHANRFITAYRLGGFRPMLFMESGIALGGFMLTTVLAAVALRRSGQTLVHPVVTRFVPPYLFVILILCRSLGSIVYGLILVPVQWLLRPEAILRVAAVLAVIVCVYPAARLLGAGPTHALLEAAATVNTRRAASLEHRFKTEDKLTGRASEKLLLGWGGFNRALIDEEDGSRIREVDGFWILRLGQRGVVGLVGALALLLGPIWVAFRRRRQLPQGMAPMLVACVALCVAARAVDMLPNGEYGPWPFYLSGALYGVVTRLRRRSVPDDGSETGPQNPPSGSGRGLGPETQPAVPPSGRFADLLGRGPR